MRSRDQFRLQQKKRYDARRFSNPYFKRVPKTKWGLIVGLTGLGLALVCLVGALFASPFFAIQRVSVTGTESIPPDDISQKAWNELSRPRAVVFRASNRFLYDEQALRGALASAYAFESLDIRRTCDWRGGGCELFVSVREKTSQLLWVAGSQMYLVDLHGVVTRELAPAEIESWKKPDPPPADPLPDGSIPASPPPDPLKRFPVFEDLNASAVTIGSPVLTETEVANILEFERELGLMNLPFSRVSIDRLAGKWMAGRTLAGYDILFDAVGDIAAQALRFRVLLRETLKDTHTLQYIDLRFGDHVYYK